jgi:hypothetical protein
MNFGDISLGNFRSLLEHCYCHGRSPCLEASLTLWHLLAVKRSDRPDLTSKNLPCRLSRPISDRAAVLCWAQHRAAGSLASVVARAQLPAMLVIGQGRRGLAGDDYEKGRQL